MEKIDLVRVTEENIEREHICCAIGNDAQNRKRAEVKKNWMAGRFPEGHVFLKADVRGKAFIEYGPAEAALFPVEAPGWLFAQCFWVSGRFAGTGLGSRLLEAAEADARRKAGLFFLAAAKGKKPFLSDGRYLRLKGYVVADEALGFALFAKKSGPQAVLPRFSEPARTGRLEYSSEGLDFFWSRQCPFVQDLTEQMSHAAESLGHVIRIHEVNGSREARALRSPPGIFQVYLNGKFLTHEIMPPEKFARLLPPR